jgi:hypothetical protein
MHYLKKRNTARALAAARARARREDALPAPSIVRDLVAAFTEEIVTRHEKLRDAYADNDEAYYTIRKESRASNMAHDYAREQGKSEDDERIPAAYLSGEVDSLRGTILAIAAHMGVEHDYDNGNLLTSRDAGKLMDRVLARWHRVELAATRHGWTGDDGLPEEHLDGEVSRWRARAITAQDATMPRLRGHIGD